VKRLKQDVVTDKDWTGRWRPNPVHLGSQENSESRNRLGKNQNRDWTGRTEERETPGVGAVDVRVETSDLHQPGIEPEARLGEQTQTHANTAREGKAKPVAARDRLRWLRLAKRLYARRIQTEKSDRSFCARVEQGAWPADLDKSQTGALEKKKGNEPRRTENENDSTEIESRQG
jgi:hypothetical protein